METCASYTFNFWANNTTQYQETTSIVPVYLTTMNLHTILTSNILKYPRTPITTTNNNNNSNNDYNRSEMDTEGSNLDLISNWKTVPTTNEEENEMAISVYIGIHVVIGLIGVFFNGW